MISGKAPWKSFFKSKELKLEWKLFFEIIFLFWSTKAKGLTGLFGQAPVRSHETRVRDGYGVVKFNLPQVVIGGLFLPC